MDRDAVVSSVFTPVRAATTFEETVERMGTAIRAGILPAGSRLPAERMLAKERGISRSTLRQAIATLRAERPSALAARPRRWLVRDRATARWRV